MAKSMESNKKGGQSRAGGAFPAAATSLWGAVSAFVGAGSVLILRERSEGVTGDSRALQCAAGAGLCGILQQYIYSVMLHNIANFQFWIIFITAVSRMITGFFSVVNFRQIYILLNVWRRNFQFVNTMRISMQRGAALAAGGD